jgi:hypothetical protein
MHWIIEDSGRDLETNAVFLAIAGVLPLVPLEKHEYRLYKYVYTKIALLRNRNRRAPFSATEPAKSKTPLPATAFVANRGVLQHLTYLFKS